MNSLTLLESQVLAALLDGEDDVLNTLRAQASFAEVAARRMTGVGFFTEFSVPPNVKRVVGRPSFKIGDVNGTAKNVKHGLGFLLYITDGVLTTMEGYTYDEPWPSEIESLSLSYAGGAQRNLDSLRKVWATTSS